MGVPRFGAAALITLFCSCLLVGRDHFSPCFHVQGLRVMLRFTQSKDPSFAGDLVYAESGMTLPECKMHPPRLIHILKLKSSGASHAKISVEESRSVGSGKYPRVQLSRAASHFLHCSVVPILEARPCSVWTHGRLCHGGSCRTCWVWPHARSATQCVLSS